jgi:biopolymer transport protein TolR
MARREKFTPSSDLNLTSMTDILFMLLFVVMITAPMMHAQIDLDLPKSTAARVTDETAVSVSITSDGNVFLDKSPVKIEELAKKIWSLKETKGITSVSLRADKKVYYESLMKVIAAIKDGGIEDLGLVAIPEKTAK